MANRNKRSLGIDYSILASESEKLTVSPCSLEAASSILHIAFDNQNLKFKQISASPDFIPILHYCAISVRRFSFDPINDIQQLLSIAKKSEVGTLAEELFILEIFIINGIKFSNETHSYITDVYPIFEKDLEVTLKKTRDIGYLTDAMLKPRGDVNPEEVLPDKKLIQIYGRSEIEFWSLILEFHRFDVLRTLIQDLRTSKKIDFPTEYLLSQIRGSTEAMDVIKDYIMNSFDLFYSDQRWFAFVEHTPELINYMITDVLPTLKPSQVNTCGELYVTFLQQFMYQVFRGAVEIEKFVDFVYLTGDENFINVLETNNAIAVEFKELFLTYFDTLFANKRWCKFTEKSELVLKYIAIKLYPHVPVEMKQRIPGLNERLLDRLLLDENIEQIVDFLYGLPSDFLKYQFEQNEDTAVAFKNMFTINFDSYIVDKRVRELILANDVLLDIIMTNIVPKTDTKQKNICQDMYAEYLYRKVAADERTAQPLADFVKDITTISTVDFLKFDNLIPTLQFNLFEAVAKRLTKEEFLDHKTLYTDFFTQFLKRQSLCLLLPVPLRKIFYQLVVVPYLSNNTLELTNKEIFSLVTFLTDDPFAEMERPPFYTFLVENQKELIFDIYHDENLLNKIWEYVNANEKECRALESKNLIFKICIYLLRKTLPVDSKLFHLTIQSFSTDIFNTEMTLDTKTDVILQLSRCFQRPIEVLLPEKEDQQDYIKSAEHLLELFAQDNNFITSITITLNDENANFISILLDVFQRDKPFKAILEKPDLFIKFLSQSLELYPVKVKSTILTQDRFEDLFIFFNKNSLLISQDDIVRHALLNLFLANHAKVDMFLPCVTSPYHRASIYTEFSDPTKNSVLNTLFQTYFVRTKKDTPIANIFNVYVTVMNLPYIKVKAHRTVINKCAEAFLTPDQSQFDNCFPQQRSLEIEAALYGMGKAIGVHSLIKFVDFFKDMKAGPQNCYKEATENAILRFTPEMQEEIEKAKELERTETAESAGAIMLNDDEFINYQKEHARFKRFSQDLDKFPEFAQGLLAFAIILYLSILSYTDNKAVTVTLSLLCSVCTFVSAFIPEYFPILNKPGFTIWFLIQVILQFFIFGLGMAAYGVSVRYDLNAPLIFILAIFNCLTLYRYIYRIEGIPQDEYDDTDLLIIT